MAITIRNLSTEIAVRELAEVTGLGLTKAIDMAVRAQLAAHVRQSADPGAAADPRPTEPRPAEPTDRPV